MSCKENLRALNEFKEGNKSCLTQCVQGSSFTKEIGFGGTKMKFQYFECPFDSVIKHWNL